MTERERLIKLLREIGYTKLTAEDTTNYLLQNGVIVLPCKVGDFVYAKGEKIAITSIEIDAQGTTYYCDVDCDYLMDKYGCTDCPLAHFYETPEYEIDCDSYGIFTFTEENIGKTVFLTKEEAEKAMEEREK